ncbi:hypothetical protein FOQG_16581 [Fusarium oxysporum f. sp. raphani 54005]|uniref:Uncharacterized protein n=1 Tax=Fusarium oxysporum f. sp. raphani 54005 TaxID=1089458 RepID=X0C7S0_FUSOX|nr:hypothetical protein FOQG_16581 [Fusarium oxysporum f. sp. raphani 54005]
MESRLYYKQDIARAATKGLEAAMGLKRLKEMAPSTTRQLFTAIVALVVDYASNVWMHAYKTTWYLPSAPQVSATFRHLGASPFFGTASYEAAVSL